MSEDIQPRTKACLTTKLICGAIAGVVGTCIIFPIDIVKTRLQNQKNNQYRGMIDCFKQMIRSEGILGLYGGLVPNLVGIIPEKAIKLAVNDYARESWGRHLGRNADDLPIIYGMLSGATAGLCQVVATNPMEIVKIQLQLSGNQVGGHKCASTLVKKLGFRGLYRGTCATLCRDVPFSILFFSLVSVFKQLGTKKDTKTTLPVVFGSGVIAGGIAASCVTPMDVVKTRLQVVPVSGEPIYKGQLDCYRSIVAHEGYAGLYRGVIPRVLIVSVFGILTSPCLQSLFWFMNFSREYLRREI